MLTQYTENQMGGRLAGVSLGIVGAHLGILLGILGGVRISLVILGGRWGESNGDAKSLGCDGIPPPEHRSHCSLVVSRHHSPLFRGLMFCCFHSLFVWLFVVFPSHLSLNYIVTLLNVPYSVTLLYCFVFLNDVLFGSVFVPNPGLPPFVSHDTSGYPSLVYVAYSTCGSWVGGQGCGEVGRDVVRMWSDVLLPPPKKVDEP